MLFLNLVMDAVNVGVLLQEIWGEVCLHTYVFQKLYIFFLLFSPGSKSFKVLVLKKSKYCAVSYRTAWGCPRLESHSDDSSEWGMPLWKLGEWVPRSVSETCFKVILLARTTLGAKLEVVSTWTSRVMGPSKTKLVRKATCWAGTGLV